MEGGDVILKASLIVCASVEFGFYQYICCQRHSITHFMQIYSDTNVTIPQYDMKLIQKSYNLIIGGKFQQCFDGTAYVWTLRE